MSLYSSLTYLEDLDIATNEVIGIDMLRDAAVLVTGATGTIGSFIVDLLLHYNEKKEGNIKIYAMGRNYSRLSSRFDENKTDKLIYVEQDILKPVSFDSPVDYIIHTAGNAHPAVFSSDPVGTIMGNIDSTYRLLEYGKACGAKRFLYVSSGEVYGTGDVTLEEYNETYGGYVDPTSARSCYPSSKRTGETLCVSYFKQYGLETVIVRPCHTYGPCMTNSDSRAHAQFFRNALNGEDIVLKSSGSQMRSYCYVADCVSAMLTVLVNGESGEAYNIANPNARTTIRDFAQTIAKSSGRKCIFATPTVAELSGQTPIPKQVLSSKKLEALGWKARYDIKTGIKSTLSILEAANFQSQTVKREIHSSPLISVIVPCYNTESELLECCIRSILAQNFSDFELLIIDDGSEGACRETLERISSWDKRIILHTQTNQGVSAARNLGIHESRGKYITFVDSDDMVLPFFLSHSYEVAEREQADFVIGGTRLINDNSISIDTYDQENINEFVPYLMGKILRFGGNSYINRGMAARLFKTDIAKKILFRTDMVISEDVIWFFELLRKCAKICVVHQTWYLYFVNPSSATRKYNENVISQAGAHLNLIPQFINMESDTEYISYIDRMFEQFWDVVFRCFLGHEDFTLTRRERKKVIHDLYVSEPWKHLGDMRYIKLAPVRKKIKAILFRLHIYIFTIDFRRFIAKTKENVKGWIKGGMDQEDAEKNS